MLKIEKLNYKKVVKNPKKYEGIEMLIETDENKIVDGYICYDPDYDDEGGYVFMSCDEFYYDLDNDVCDFYAVHRITQTEE